MVDHENGAQVMKQLRYLAFAGYAFAILFSAGCVETLSARQAVAGEQLLAQPPSGWRQTGATSAAGMRTAEFVPDDEDSENWVRRIRFESLNQQPLPDPLEFTKLLEDDLRQRCDPAEAFGTFAGIENGYATSVNLLICHRDRESGQSEVTMVKTIQGGDHFYVVTRSKRGPAVEEDQPAIEQEVIAAWSLYMKSIGVCDTDRTGHPCPREPAG